jgi:hypothetical protein
MTKKKAAAPVEPATAARPRAGGSYVRDRKTGKLTRVAATVAEDAPIAAEPVDAAQLDPAGTINGQAVPEAGETEA